VKAARKEKPVRVMVEYAFSGRKACFFWLLYTEYIDNPDANL
jgi:hypothetical protein